MLKRKIFAVALPLVVGATIVGAGFSAWVFNNHTVSNKTNIGVTITEEVDFSTITATMKYSTLGQPKVYNDLTQGTAIGLVLDQGNAIDKTVAEEKKGIHFTVGNNGDVLEKIKIEFSGESAELAKLTSAGYRVQIDLNFAFNKVLMDYVKLPTNKADWTNVANLNETSVGSYNYTLSTNLTPVDTQVGVDGLKAFEFYFGSVVDTNTGKNYHSNKMFDWKAKPKNTTELKAMRDKLKTLNGNAPENSGVSIKFDFKLVETKAI